MGDARYQRAPCARRAVATRHGGQTRGRRYAHVGHGGATLRTAHAGSRTRRGRASYALLLPAQEVNDVLTGPSAIAVALRHRSIIIGTIARGAHFPTPAHKPFPHRGLAPHFLRLLHGPLRNAVCPPFSREERADAAAHREAARESEGGNHMFVNTADLVTDFFRRRAKILILTFFTYAALC